MRTLLHGLLAASLTLGALSATAADAPEPLALTYIRSNADYWDLNVAVDKGFLAEEGFKPEYVANSSSVQSTQLLLTQSVQLAVAQPESLVAVIARGSKDLAAIAAPMRRVDWVLVGQKGMKAVTELKGKTVGFSGLRVAEFYLTQDAMAKQGTPAGSFDGIQIGTSVAKYAALTNGSVAAAVLFEPTASQAVQAGFSKLYELGNHEGYIPAMYIVKKSWASTQNHGMRLARALERAHAWLYDPKNKAEAIAILKKHSQSTDAAIEDVYNRFFVTHAWYTKAGEIETDAIKIAIQTLLANKEITQAQVPAMQDVILLATLGGRTR